MTTTHPTIERFKARLAVLKCQSKTSRGLLGYWNSLCAGQQRSLFWGTYGKVPVSRESAVRAWEKAVAARKADGDAKRAQADKAFRTRYLARLRRQEKALLAYRADNLDQLLAYVDSREARNEQLCEIARLRSIVTGKRCEPLHLGSCEDGIVIPITVSNAKNMGADVIMRGSNCKLVPCRCASYGDHQDHVTRWKGGRPRTLVSSRHINYVRSVAMIDSPQVVEYQIHQTRIVITLPDGYTWGQDAIGLFAQCGPDEYHVTGADLISRNPAKTIVELLHEKRRMRDEMRAKASAERASLDGVYVCLADSLRGGNCLAGTLRFGEAHHLDPDRHYSALELLAIPGVDSGRVRLAITAARLRHAREMEAGVCVLADHRQGVLA